MNYQKLPKEELYSLTDQIRIFKICFCKYYRSLEKRRYEKSFIAKPTDLARETQTWLQFALKCRYINEEQFNNFTNQYNQIIGILVNMTSQSKSWCTFSPVN
ncbi:four helix bundle protein [Chryseobacterium sp. FH2]|uniref:four helix bundle protein n=1 Tax=Chryseobacterium sp. FH2 TaxID=1674291 RepID=UPI00069D0419|nr:four helix bundle protein [Chryseobacterium sp. FH2]